MRGRKKIEKIAIMTSGGDAPGLNACIRAAVRTALYHRIQVTGIQHGFEGMINGDFLPLTSESVGNIIHKGGTILKTFRSEKFRTRSGRAAAYRNLAAESIDAVVLIGGDGSFRGANAFIKEYKIPFMGIPKTIDNDISGTEVCIGFDTALNTAMEAIDRLRDTAESHERIFIVEVMGRDSGYIAYGAGLAGGAESILIPETKADLQHLEQIFRKGWSRKKSSLIVVVAEGDETGGAYKIAEQLRKSFSAHYIGVCILGHIQRGGSPSAADRVLASRLGFAAIEGLLRGEKNVMVGMKKGQLVFTPLRMIKRHHLDVSKEILNMLNVLTS